MTRGLVIVTGGASGIGESIVEHAALSGYKVASFDIDDKLIEDLSNKSTDDNISYHYVDICNEEIVSNAVEEAIQKHGEICGLVNCAGIGQLIPFDDLTADVFRKTLEVNVVGTFIVTQQVVRRMHKGAIVNISSVSGTHGNIHRTAYGSSKGAMNTMTKILASELAPKNIRINAIAPGPIETPLALKHHDQKTRSLWTNRLPMGRYGSVQEIASMTLTLLDDDVSSYLTGQVIAIDGGFSTAGLFA